MRHGRVFASHVEGRGFDPQPGQKVIRIFSPVTFGAQRKIILNPHAVIPYQIRNHSLWPGTSGTKLSLVWENVTGYRYITALVQSLRAGCGI